MVGNPIKKIGRKPQFDPNQNSPKIHPKTDQMAPKLVEEIQLKIGSKSQLDPRKTKNPSKWHQKWLKIQSKIGSKLQLDPKNPTKNWLKIQPKIGNKPQHDPKTQKTDQMVPKLVLKIQPKIGSRPQLDPKNPKTKPSKLIINRLTFVK